MNNVHTSEVTFLKRVFEEYKMPFEFVDYQNLNEQSYLRYLETASFVLYSSWSEHDSQVVKEIMAMNIPLFCIRTISCRYMCRNCGSRLDILLWNDEEKVYFAFAKFLHFIEQGRYQGGADYIKVTRENYMKILIFLRKIFPVFRVHWTK